MFTKFFLSLLSLLTLIPLTGCLAPTQSTITEYRDDGTVERVTVTSESVVKTVTESTKLKTVVAWNNSWLIGAIIVPPASSAENPAGAVKFLAGKNDEGAATLSDKHDAKHLPEIIRSARAGELKASTNGIGSTSAAE